MGQGNSLEIDFSHVGFGYSDKEAAREEIQTQLPNELIESYIPPTKFRVLISMLLFSAQTQITLP